jgi:hypothetical protein
VWAAPVLFCDLRDGREDMGQSATALFTRQRVHAVARTIFHAEATLMSRMRTCAFADRA